MYPSGSPRPRLGVTLSFTVLVVLVGVTVFGILGMHALGSHGIGTHGLRMDGVSLPAHLTDGQITAVTFARHDGAHAAVRSDTVASPLRGAAASQDSLDETVDVGGGGPGLPDMVMLCLAMLAAAAGILLLLPLLRRLARRPFRLPTLQASIAPPAWTGGGTGPPYVWNFSVIRC